MLFEIVLALFIVFVSRELWRRWKYDLHKVPSPPGFLLRGHTLEFTREAINNFPKWFRKHYNALGCPKILKVNPAFRLISAMSLVQYRKQNLGFRNGFCMREICDQ